MHLSTLSFLLLALSVNAGIGPVADLYIVNRKIAPDGVRREYVSHRLFSLELWLSVQIPFPALF